MVYKNHGIQMDKNSNNLYIKMINVTVYVNHGFQVDKKEHN